MIHSEFITSGGIALTLLNVYSSLVLETQASTVIFDPVKLDLDKLDYLRSIDVIVITHEHVDHFDEKIALEIERRSQAPILTTPFVARRLEHSGGKARGLRLGESVQIKDVTFYTEDCLHPANQPLSFIMRTEAVTIFHPADSQPFPGMKEIGSKYMPDLMLYMGAARDDLAGIIELVRPKVVVTHFIHKFTGLETPGVKLQMLKRLETMKYP